MAPLNGYHLISLVGRQGSGKSFLGGKLSALLNCGRIEISDVVRSLNKDLSRADLPGTAARTVSEPTWLTDVLINVVSETRLKVGSDVVILTGGRETSVHKHLAKAGATVWPIHIACNPYTRCERLLRLGKVKSVHEFLMHEVRESKMGIQLIMAEAPTRVVTSDTSDPDELMKKLLTSLKKRGAA